MSHSRGSSECEEIAGDLERLYNVCEEDSVGQNGRDSGGEDFVPPDNDMESDDNTGKW